MKLKRAEDLAKKLGIEKDALLGWREMGMPWVRIGKLIYIFEDSFIEWARGLEIKQNAQNAPGQDFFGKPIGEVTPPKN
jgi:hypothetical protein